MIPSPDGFQRIVVIGSSGSGKTTFAGQLATRLDATHIELDALHWGPGWQPRSEAEFTALVHAAIEAPRWVCDGNYSKVRATLWPAAQALVWLDLAFPLVWSRVILRTAHRILTREPLWNGNIETLRGALFDRDAIIWWVPRTYWRRKRETPALLTRPEYAHLALIQLHTPREVAAWLAHPTG